MENIIEITQLPVITEQLILIKTQVEEKVKKATALECNENTVKDVKAARAELNKDFQGWEDKRKEVKSKIMTPYENFESVYKECITHTYTEAGNELKRKIDAVEDELKRRKKEEVTAYYSEYAAAKNIDFVSFERAGINITLSASIKNLKEQCAKFLDKVAEELALIDTQEYKSEILVEYKKYFNAAMAITIVSDRHKEMEAEEKAQKERAEKESAEAATAAEIDKVIDDSPDEILTAPIVEEPKYKMSFTIKGTKAQLTSVKNYITSLQLEII